MLDDLAFSIEQVELERGPQNHHVVKGGFETGRVQDTVDDDRRVEDDVVRQCAVQALLHLVLVVRRRLSRHPDDKRRDCDEADDDDE